MRQLLVLPLEWDTPDKPVWHFPDGKWEMNEWMNEWIFILKDKAEIQINAQMNKEMKERHMNDGIN